MTTLKLKTNINCNGCKSKVANFLNSETAVKKWDVDINNPEKVLIVEGENITEKLILDTIAKAGFKGSAI